MELKSLTIDAARSAVQERNTTALALAEAHYARRQRYSGDAEIPIVLDGREVGRVAA